MRETSQARIPGRASRRARALVLCAACVAALAGYALSETAAPSSQPEAKPETLSATEVKGGAAPKAEIEPASEAKGTVSGQGTGDSEPTAMPEPKWACDRQTVTAEPVWRGEKSLTFTFDIRNEGTADLRINAGGG